MVAVFTASSTTNYFGRRLGLGYWSLAAYIKNRIRNARQVIGIFERAAVAEAARQGLDGLRCRRDYMLVKSSRKRDTWRRLTIGFSSMPLRRTRYCPWALRSMPSMALMATSALR
jgi:hypothetical protein